MELVGLKRRWKDRREAYERRERELEHESSEKLAVDASSGDNCSNIEHDSSASSVVNNVCESKIRAQYADLQQSSLQDAMNTRDSHN